MTRYPIILLSILILFLLKLIFLVLPVYAKNPEGIVVEIEWGETIKEGSVNVMRGHLSGITIVNGKGKIFKNSFSFQNGVTPRISITIVPASADILENTIVTLKTDKNEFSFFLKDVNTDFPIYSPDYRVAVLDGTDNRSFQEVEHWLLSKKLKTKLAGIESEEENSFDLAKDKVIVQEMPIWLGLGQDVRMFEVSESSTHHPKQVNTITPQYISSPVLLKEANNRRAVYGYALGRGQGVKVDSERRLENGVLPILNSIYKDNEITYRSTYFVSYIETTLHHLDIAEGTSTSISDMFSNGYRASPGYVKEREQETLAQLPDLLNNAGNAALYFRAEAVNESDAPRYAWFKTAFPGENWSATKGYNYSFDKKTGFSSYSEDKVFAVTKLNGNPLTSEEVAVLLKPGEKAVLEFFIPHTPVSSDKATLLSEQSFSEHYKGVIRYWDRKLTKAAKIKLPEKRIEEMMQAGLLHLDLVSFGSKSEEVLAANAGRFLPIGTESAPIIQFYCSMGWHDAAKKALVYFLKKQHDDGSLMNYQDYMVETGAVLWSIGEYYRYTKDSVWVQEVSPKLLKACRFLMSWRDRNKTDSLKGRGYGMIDGKVADPDDHYRQFMLNGYGYLGLKRMAEIFSALNLPERELVAREAGDWKEDIRTAFISAIGRSPLVPMADGTWTPTAPPWIESEGPRALYSDRDSFFSHGTFTAPDAMLGPLYLVFCEVIAPDEWLAKKILDFQSELFFEENAAFSQPYYSRHNWMQASRGMVKPFLQTYYNTMAAMADRDTYTFTEHTYPNSVHKVHEEAWFLMETRWMLYMEEGNSLKLFNTIPRAWMGDGSKIELENLSSYFGPLNVTLHSVVNEGKIYVDIRCTDNSEMLKKVVVRVPHPENKFPKRVEGGVYNKDTESVTIDSFNRAQQIVLYYE